MPWAAAPWAAVSCRACSAAMQKAVQPDPLLDAVFVRPPQADIDTCMASVTGAALTHAKIVRVATCLHRKHLVSATTVAAVKSDTSLGGGTGIVGLKSKSETVWRSFAIWGVALALIILVVYRHRHRRRRPGGFFRRTADLQAHPPASRFASACVLRRSCPVTSSSKTSRHVALVARAAKRDSLAAVLAL